MTSSMYTKTLCPRHQLHTRIVTQGENKASILRQTKKNKHSKIPRKNCKTYDKIINKTIMYRHLNFNQVGKKYVYVCIGLCLFCLFVYICMCVYVYVYLLINLFCIRL